MPVTIRRHGNGYRVTFSPGIPGTRGFSIDVVDHAQIDLAVRHWHTGHEGGKSIPECPLCQRVDSYQQHTRSHHG